jgi:uncharacterized membrane protein YvlD (DUF360 family)
MKGLLQKFIITAIALYLTATFIPGLVITGGIIIFLEAAIAFVIAGFVLRPVLSIFAFPFAFLSAAIVILAANVIALYITALLFGAVKVVPFNITAVSFYGFHVSTLHLGPLLSYVVVSAIIAIAIKVQMWLFDLE